jgi:nicotinic acid mononucleotide adenylyltransferase
MCKLAFSNIKNTQVLTLENLLPTPSYTIHTIEAILKLRPDLQLSLVMGSDLMEHFDDWEGAGQIRQHCQLSVFDRTLLLPGVQSSQIRKAIKLGDTKNLDLGVKAYIEKNRFYSKTSPRTPLQQLERGSKLGSGSKRLPKNLIVHAEALAEL